MSPRPSPMVSFLGESPDASFLPTRPRRSQELGAELQQSRQQQEDAEAGGMETLRGLDSVNTNIRVYIYIYSRCINIYKVKLKNPCYQGQKAHKPLLGADLPPFPLPSAPVGQVGQPRQSSFANIFRVCHSGCVVFVARYPFWRIFHGSREATHLPFLGVPVADAAIWIVVSLAPLSLQFAVEAVGGRIRVKRVQILGMSRSVSP